VSIISLKQFFVISTVNYNLGHRADTFGDLESLQSIVGKIESLPAGLIFRRVDPRQAGEVMLVKHTNSNPALR
jgi:hypothetical protein